MEMPSLPFPALLSCQGMINSRLPEWPGATSHLGPYPVRWHRCSQLRDRSSGSAGKKCARRWYLRHQSSLHCGGAHIKIHRGSGFETMTSLGSVLSLICFVEWVEFFADCWGFPSFFFRFYSSYIYHDYPCSTHATCHCGRGRRNHQYVPLWRNSNSGAAPYPSS